MSMEVFPPVVAAGAVCWRMMGTEVQVLLVHRAERNDISLPKGKVDPGETPPQTAIREVVEETGLAITLGAPLGTIEYPLSGNRKKLVHYWVAEVDGTAIASRFTPNHEIAEIEWLPVAQAREKLSYERDREVLDRFAERVRTGTVRTFAIIALRHGKAVPGTNWDGPDATRPLLHRGLVQANSIAPAIAAWHPIKLISSTATRCLDTIAPLAGLLGLPVKHSVGISQDGYDSDRVRRVVTKRIRKGANAVLCSHGPVLPEIIAAVAAATRTPVDARLRAAARLATGSYAVLHLSHENPVGDLVAVETHEPPYDVVP